MTSIGFAIATGAGLAIAAQQPLGQELEPGEILENSGIDLSPPTDLRQFFRQTVPAFVGTAEGVRVQFLPDPNNPPYAPPYAVQTFRPTEVIKGSVDSSTVEVWHIGGTYIWGPNGREARRPDVTLPPGMMYFVAAGRTYGKYYVSDSMSVMKIDGTRVTGALLVVTVEPHRFGGIEFRVGRREFGPREAI